MSTFCHLNGICFLLAILKIVITIRISYAIIEKEDPGERSQKYERGRFERTRNANKRSGCCIVKHITKGLAAN